MILNDFLAKKEADLLLFRTYTSKTNNWAKDFTTGL